MICPYTMAMRYYHNLVGLFEPSAPLFYKFRRINGMINEDNVTAHGASTVRGNYNITVHPHAEGVTLDNILISEIHSMLRWTVGTLGKKLDQKQLDDTIRKNITAFDETLHNYRSLTKQEVAFFEKQHPDPIQAPLYNDLPGMRHNVLSDTMDELKLSTKKAGRAAGVAVNKLNTSFSTVSSFFLKGDAAPVSNKSTQDIKNPAQWLFYAGRAAAVFMDTVRVPESVNNTYRDIVEVSNDIVPRIIMHLENHADMRRPVIMNVFRDGLERLGNSVVQCAPYEDLHEDTMGRKIMSILEIDSEQDYNTILVRSGQPKPSKKNELRNFTSGAKCPLGFGPK